MKPNDTQNESTEIPPLSVVTSIQGSCNDVSQASSLSSLGKLVSLRSVLQKDDSILFNKLYCDLQAIGGNQSSITKLEEELKKNIADDRKVFDEAISASVAEKVVNLRLFSAMLLKSENSSVAKVFLLFTAAIFVVPLLVLFVVMKMCEWSELASSFPLIGGLSSLASVIIIMAAYVAYAFYEDWTPSVSNQGSSCKAPARRPPPKKPKEKKN